MNEVETKAEEMKERIEKNRSKVGTDYKPTEKEKLKETVVACAAATLVLIGVAATTPNKFELVLFVTLGSLSGLFTGMSYAKYRRME